MPPPREEAAPAPALSGLQAVLLVLLVLTLVGSVGLRAVRGAGQPGEGAAGVPSGAQGLVQGDQGATVESAPEPTPLERALPYLTEASFFGLIGFALGFATRKFVKLLLILLALFFLGLQALVWTGSVSVDWGGLIGKLNALIFNLQENESMTAFLTRRVPSGGSLLLGWAVGFRRS